MILCYAGTPGSCKTLEAVKRMVENIHLCAKAEKLYYSDPVKHKKYLELSRRKIYTNIRGLDQATCLEQIAALTGVPLHSMDPQTMGISERVNFLNSDQILRYWEHAEVNGIIFIDEVHKIISNREWQTEKNKDFNEAASTHRQDGFDIILITQDVKKVDSHTRGLIEFTYFYRKNNFFGSLIQTKYFCYTYTGDNHEGTPLSRKQCTMDKRLYGCYQSYTHSVVKEISFQTPVNILKHPVFILIPIMMCFTIYQFCKSDWAHGHLLPGQNKKGSILVKPVGAAIVSKIDSGNVTREVMNDYSSSRNQKLATMKNVNIGLTNIAALDYFQVYKIQGIYRTGHDVWLLVNGLVVKETSKYLKNVDEDCKICMGMFRKFGDVIVNSSGRLTNELALAAEVQKGIKNQEKQPSVIDELKTEMSSGRTGQPVLPGVVVDKGSSSLRK